MTITAVNDDAYTGNRMVAVSGTAVNSVGITDPDDVTLTITDDDVPAGCESGDIWCATVEYADRFPSDAAGRKPLRWYHLDSDVPEFTHKGIRYKVYTSSLGPNPGGWDVRHAAVPHTGTFNSAHWAGQPERDRPYGPLGDAQPGLSRLDAVHQHQPRRRHAGGEAAVQRSQILLWPQVEMVRPGPLRTERRLGSGQRVPAADCGGSAGRPDAGGAGSASLSGGTGSQPRECARALGPPPGEERRRPAGRPLQGPVEDSRRHVGYAGRFGACLRTASRKGSAELEYQVVDAG